MSLEAGPEFEAVIDFMRDSRGVDFSGYKRASLLRRIAKRCHELGVDSFGAYLDHLQVHADEIPIVFNSILINVTEFFRDRPTWDYLAQEIIPKIVAKGGHIRVWSTGTASGEEAYSAAILLCEALGEERFLRRVKIYGTDIDEDALAKARSGYSAKDLESVPDDIRNRYFEAHNGRLAFRSALRRALIFGRHDLMQDAPISRLDLLICRNTLMYFTAEAQSRILARFHYALDADGYLFLGRAEMLLTHGALFAPVNMKHRVFSKVAQLQLRDRIMLLAESGGLEATNSVARQLRVRELASEGTPYPQLVVDALGAVVTANQLARRLFGIGPEHIGRPLRELELASRPTDLGTPVDRAFRERRQVVLHGVRYTGAEGKPAHYDTHITPLTDDDGSVLGVSVTLIDGSEMATLRGELDRMKQDLETAHEELESSNEELETTNEELQSTVEELETTNEELQSSNEELETMNEELESTNAELQAINTDLRLRSDEITRLNTMLLAITGNIEVGAVVLDTNMNVQVWNERAADLWGVRSDEVVGRKFFELDIGLPTTEVRAMITTVLKDGNHSREEKVVTAVTRRGRSIRCNVMAYPLSDGQRTTGVAIVMEELGVEKPV